MEPVSQINRALQVSGSTTTDSQLQNMLSNEDGLRLSKLIEKATRRWPNQDHQETMGEYMEDFEKLVAKYSLQQVEEAMENLRIAPKQNFFPTPSEMAAEIERAVEQAKPTYYQLWQRENDRARAERQRKIAEVMAERETPEYKAWAKERGMEP